MYANVVESLWRPSLPYDKINRVKQNTETLWILKYKKLRMEKIFRLELKALGDKLYECGTNTKNLFWL